eukprot:PLAT11642.18.p1 GENE.PLAT11642.18~~PLAT11642.18.p1  ORF type:complete len:596 (-),score=329.12 PLAT11642.18:266-2053(-)
MLGRPLLTDWSGDGVRPASSSQPRSPAQRVELLLQRFNSKAASELSQEEVDAFSGDGDGQLYESELNWLLQCRTNTFLDRHELQELYETCNVDGGKLNLSETRLLLMQLVEQQRRRVEGMKVEDVEDVDTLRRFFVYFVYIMLAPVLLPLRSLTYRACITTQLFFSRLFLCDVSSVARRLLRSALDSALGTMLLWLLWTPIALAGTAVAPLMIAFGRFSYAPASYKAGTRVTDVEGQAPFTFYLVFCVALAASLAVGDREVFRKLDPRRELPQLGESAVVTGDGRRLTAEAVLARLVLRDSKAERSQRRLQSWQPLVARLLAAVHCLLPTAVRAANGKLAVTAADELYLIIASAVLQFLLLSALINMYIDVYWVYREKLQLMRKVSMLPDAQRCQKAGLAAVHLPLDKECNIVAWFRLRSFLLSSGSVDMARMGVLIAGALLGVLYYLTLVALVIAVGGVGPRGITSLPGQALLITAAYDLLLIGAYLVYPMLTLGVSINQQLAAHRKVIVRQTWQLQLRRHREMRREGSDGRQLRGAVQMLRELAALLDSADDVFRVLGIPLTQGLLRSVAAGMLSAGSTLAGAVSRLLSQLTA